MTETKRQEERLVRLRWACRRTLSELDQPLSHFLRTHYLCLPMEQQFAFERLLSASDQDILSWLKGSMPRDQGIRTVLELMRTPDDA